LVSEAAGELQEALSIQKHSRACSRSGAEAKSVSGGHSTFTAGKSLFVSLGVARPWQLLLNCDF